MKHIFLFCLCLVSGTFPLFSQALYVPGYVVNNDQDTIMGEFKNDFDSHYASSINFRKLNTEPFILYKPQELKAFFIAGKYQSLYESKQVEEKEQGKLVKKQEFLRVLIKGRINLFFRSLSLSNFHFYAEKPQEKAFLHKLERVKVKIIDTETGETQTKKRDVFRSVLNVLLLDCPEVHSRIARTHFSRKSLIRLIEQYNSCGAHGDSSTVFNQQRILHQNGLMATLYPAGSDDRNEGGINGDIIVGILHRIYLPAISKRWYAETRFTFNQFTQNNYSRNDSLIKRSQFVNLSFLVANRYNLGKIQYYINGGVSLFYVPSYYYNNSINQGNLVRKESFIAPYPTLGAGVNIAVNKTHRINMEFGLLFILPQLSVGYVF